MSRKTARKHAFLLLYQEPFHREFQPQAAAEDYLAEAPLSGPDLEFFLADLASAWANLAEIDARIARQATGWALDRISRIDLAAMRLAVCELYYRPDICDIPPAVAINEAVELCKVYGDDDSPAFVNGILRAIAAGGPG
jgi:N utilization substance protein B